MFLMFGRRRVLFFCCLSGGAGPAQTRKKKKNKQQKKKKKHAPAPSERCGFAVWAGGRVSFLLFGRGVGGGGVRVFLFVFLLFGRGACFFLPFGWGRVCFFAVWAGGVFICFAVWAGGVLFFCCLGGGREFTHLPVCLARLQATQQQKRPNSHGTPKRAVERILSFCLEAIWGFTFAKARIRSLNPMLNPEPINPCNPKPP